MSSANSFSGTETDLSSYTHESFVFYELHELIFAEALGIDLEEDYAADLLEVAAKAMQTLPEGWELEYTKANGVKIPYYIDTINRESHWTHPFFEDFKELIVESRQELLEEEEEEGEEDDEEEEEYEEYEEEEVEGIAMADEISMVTDSFLGDEIEDHSTIPDDRSINSYALQEPITEEPLLEETLPEETLLVQTSLQENASNKSNNSNKSHKSIKSSSSTKQSQQISPRATEEHLTSIPSSPFESIPMEEEKSNEIEADDHSLQISVQSHKSNKSNKSNKQDNQSIQSEHSQKSQKSQPFALIEQNELNEIEQSKKQIENKEENLQNIEPSQEIKQIEEISSQLDPQYSEQIDQGSIHEPSPPMVSAISSVTQERNDDVSVSNTTIRSQISDPKLIIHESTEEQPSHIVIPKEEEEEEPTKEFVKQSPSHSIQDKPSIAEVSIHEEEEEAEVRSQEQETEAQESSYIVDEKNETDLVSISSETTKKSELSKEEAFLKNIGTLTFIDNFPDYFTVEDTILQELEQQIPVGSDASNNDFDIDRMSSLLPPDTPKPPPFSSEFSLTSDENSSQVTNSVHKFEIIMDHQDNHSLNPINNENSSILSSSQHENEHGFATHEEDDLNSTHPIQITGYEIQNPPLESEELPHEDSLDQFDDNNNTNDNNLPHLMNILEDERFYQPPTPLDKSIDIRDHYLTMFRPVTNEITSQPNKETKANSINLPEISPSQQSNNNKKLTNLLNNNLAQNVINSPDKNFLPKLGNKLGIKKRSPKKKSPKKGEQSNDKQAPGWILLEAFDSFSEAEKVVHFFEKLYPSNSNVNKSFPIASRLMLPEEKDKINQYDASIKHVSTSIDRENLDKKTINMALGKELPKLRIARDLSRMQWLVECNDPQIKSTFNNKFVGKSPMKRKSMLLSKLKTPPLNNYNMASQTVMITNSNTKHLSKVIPFTNPNTSPKRPNKMNLTSSSTTALFDYTDNGINNQNTALLRQTSVSSNGLRMSKLASFGNSVIQPNSSFLMPKDASISQAAQNWEGGQDGPKSIRASGPRSFNVLLTRPQSTSN